MIDLELPVYYYCPKFDNGVGACDKTKILVKHLLTHVSGFPPEPDLSDLKSNAKVEEIKLKILESEPVAEVETVYCYSGMYITCVAYGG